jgi:hypothetical protein
MNIPDKRRSGPTNASNDVAFINFFSSSFEIAGHYARPAIVVRHDQPSPKSKDTAGCHPTLKMYADL